MKRWIYPLSCLIIASTVTACGNVYGPRSGLHTQNTVDQGYRTQTYQARTNTTAPGAYTTTPGAYTGYRYTGWNTTPAQTGHQINQAGAFDHSLADRVASAADNVPGVQGATAIVRGNDIVVGINTRTSGMTASQHNVIERQVHSAVRAIAPNHNIRVSSDATMVTRIRSLSQNIRGFGLNMTSGPTTVGANLTNAANDFTLLLRDLGRTVTAPFR